MQMRRVVSIDDIVTVGRRVFRRGRRLARRVVRRGRGIRAVRTQPPAGPAAPKQAPDAPKKPAAELVTRLSAVRWESDLEVSGWAYLSGIDTGHDTSDLELWLEPVGDTGAAQRQPLTVTRGTSPAVDVAAADPRHSHADGWFAATVTDQQLGTLAEGSWRFRLRLRQDGQQPVTGFGSRDNGGSAGVVHGDRSILRTVSTAEAGATGLELSWAGNDGLLLRVARPALTAAVQPAAAGWQLGIEPSAGTLFPGRILLAAASIADGGVDEVEIGTADASGGLVAAERLRHLPDDYRGALVLVSADDARHPLCWRDVPVGQPTPLPEDSELTLTPDPDGRWYVRRRSRWARLTEATIDPATHRLHVRGEAYPAAGWQQLELVGQRETWSGAVLTEPHNGFTADVELVGTDTWGHHGVVPLAGVYQVSMVYPDAGRDGDAGVTAVEIGSDRIDDLPREGHAELLRWRFDRDGSGNLQLRISPPMAADERSKRSQAVLQGWSRNIGDPLEDAVYFESFAGKFTSCSPGAIFAALRERRPDLRYYWGIRDHAVPVPDGGIPIVMHSREWWRIRATSRYLVTNSWVQRTFAKRPGQQVLQTWHGTPYKRLALDRESRSQGFVKSTKAESATWDYLLAQSDYMAEAMVSAYGYPGEPLRTGYPRNDVIHSSTADPIRDRLRQLLGISDDQQVLLYAPTWREDRTTMVDELDLGELRRRLGPDYVILARGHGNVLRRDHDHSAAGVIDVTSYPDATHLYLAADLAMTDYSSVMFDYTVTGKPLLFFVPDIDRYTSTLRGVYFDLEQLAPGPLLRTLDEVVEQVRGLDDVRRNYAGKYRAWQQKFDTWDDGGATGRVLDAVFADLL